MSRMVMFDRFLLVLGLAALPCIFMPELALVAALTIIGLPLAALMAVIPAIFFLLLLVRIGTHLLPAAGWIGGVLAAAAIVTAIPWWANSILDERAKALAAGDVNVLLRPFAAKIVAVVTPPGYWNNRETECDDFCLRALLSGELEKVLVVMTKRFDVLPDPASVVLSFHQEQRDICPVVNLRDGVRTLNIDPPDAHAKNLPTVTELMRLQIANGNCLIRSTVRLGEAEAIVMAGSVARGKTSYQAGLHLLADTVSADRLSVWLRSGENFEEQYRWTGVQVQKLFPVLFPTYVGGPDFRVRNGFYRQVERINIEGQFYHEPDMTAFYTKTLGLHLALDPAGVDATRTAALNHRLDNPGEIDAAARDIADDFFEDMYSNAPITVDKAEQALRLIADERLPVPRSTVAFTRRLEGLPSDIVVRTGNVLFSRLMRMEQAPSAWKVRKLWYYEATAIGTAIGALPASGVVSHGEDLSRLARMRSLRVPASHALRRLADFGAGSIPTLLYVIDDAERFRKDHNEMWQLPYQASLTGICNLGPKGAPAIVPLLARIDRKQAPVTGSQGNLMVNTLVAIGAGTDEIWSRVAAADPKAKRASFDHMVARARAKPDCGY